jgi:hypothetical protein
MLKSRPKENKMQPVASIHGFRLTGLRVRYTLEPPDLKLRNRNPSVPIVCVLKGHQFHA